MVCSLCITIYMYSRLLQCTNRIHNSYTHKIIPTCKEKVLFKKQRSDLPKRKEMRIYHVEDKHFDIFQIF